MPSSTPTILFLAGAFAEPDCFDAIAAEFRKAHFPTTYATVLSVNPENPRSVSTSRDAQHVRDNFLLPLLNDGNDVILLVHSYGGVVGGAAAAGLSKHERAAEGKSGGVIGFLCVPAVLTTEGQSLLQAVGGAYPPFIVQDYPSDGLAVIRPVMDILYNDMDPESSQKPQLEAAMIPHALAAFETPAGAPAWAEAAYNGRRGYIRTLDDQTNPVILQDLWVRNSSVEWESVNLKAGHCAFISQPQELAGLCLAFFKKWLG